MCNHPVCLQHSFTTGVAVIPLLKYLNKDWVCLVGKERDGQYKDKLNLCAGGKERNDHGCCIRAARRELSEEFKIDMTMEEFQNKFKMWYVKEKTLVFIGVFTGLTRKTLNFHIFMANSNQGLPWCEREMEFVDWVRLDNFQQLDKTFPKTSVSSFVIQVLNEIKRNNSFFNFM